MYSLIEGAQLNGINRSIISLTCIRIGDQPVRHIAELLPCNWQPIETPSIAG